MADTVSKIIQIVIPTDELLKNAARVQDELNGLKTQLDNLNKSYKKGDDPGEYAKRQVLLTNKIKEGQRMLNAYNKEIQANTREQRINENTISGLRAKVARLTLDWSNAERGTRSYTKAQKELTKAQKELSKAESGVGIFNRGVGSYSQSIIKSFTRMGAAVLSFGTAFRVLKSATKTITDFEQANANLATILGKSRGDIVELTNSAKELGRTTEWMASQVTQLQTELAKLGFNERQITAMQAPILQFATALQADLPRAASVAGAALRAFGYRAEETERVVSVLTVGANRSALSFEFFETAMKNIAPVARAYGFEIEDTVALLGALANAGFDASTASTATRNILLNLADANGKLAKRMKEPVKNFDDLVKGLKQLNAEGIDLATTFELTDKRSVAAFNTFLGGTEDLTKLRAVLNDTGGELERIQSEQLNTVQGSVKLLNSAWEGLMLSFSNSSGWMKGVIDALTDMVNWLDQVINKTEYLEEKAKGEFNNSVDQRALDLKANIDAFKKRGLSEERAIEAMLDEWNKELDEIKKLQDLYLAISKDLQEKSEGGFELMIPGGSTVAFSGGHAKEELEIVREILNELAPKAESLGYTIANYRDILSKSTETTPPTTTPTLTPEQIKAQETEMRKLEDLVLSMRKDGADKEIAILEAKNRREIEDLRQRLEEDKNLTAEAREAINGQIVLLEDKLQTDTQAVRDKYSKEDLAKQIKNAQLKVEIAVKGSEEELRLKLAKLELERQAEIKNAEQTGADVSFINARYNKMMGDARQQHNADFWKSQLKDREERARQLILQAGNDEMAVAEAELIAAQDKNRYLLSLDAAQKEALFESEQAYKTAVLESEADIRDAKQKTADVSTQAALDQLTAVSSITDAMSGVFEAFAEDSEEFAGFSKALALFTIGIETATAIVKAINGAQGMPFPANLIAMATSVTAVLSAIAQAKKLLSKESTPKAPKFHTGGIVEGSGEVPATLLSGESVMNREATSMFGSLLSSMNVFAGGKAIQVSNMPDSRGADFFKSAFKEALKEMPSPIVTVKDYELARNKVRVVDDMTRI